MADKFDKNTSDNNEKKVVPVKKKGKNDVIIKVLIIACVICAVALIAVIVMAFVGGDDAVTPGNATAGDITTTQSPSVVTFPDVNNAVPSTAPTSQTTTAPSTTAASNERLVYTIEEVNVRSGPSTDDEILAVLPANSSVIFISVDEEGWCKVMYDNEVCYIYRDYLTTKKPETTTQAGATSTTRKTINLNHNLWYLVVVDKTRQMPEGYVPELEYVDSSDTEELDARVVPYYNAMVEAAYEDGIELVANSGYRSYETQEENLNSLIEEYMYDYDLTEEEAEAEAIAEILPPGCSEHNLGLAMDIGSIEYDFIYSEEYEWLAEHAHEYGFIERYTEEKQDITGIIPEPWHWRFVGPAHAAKIKNAGVTLEEYLQYYGAAY